MKYWNEKEKRLQDAPVLKEVVGKIEESNTEETGNAASENIKGVEPENTEGTASVQSEKADVVR